MAEYRDVTQLETLATVPDTATIIVIVDGMAKQISIATLKTILSTTSNS